VERPHSWLLGRTGHARRPWLRFSERASTIRKTNMGLSWEQSGKGEVPMTLADVQEIALQLGYVKEGVAATKPLGARVTMGPFFDQYGVKAFSNFKKKFYAEPLVPIAPGGTPMAAKTAVRPRNQSRDVDPEAPDEMRTRCTRACSAAASSGCTYHHWDSSQRTRRLHARRASTFGRGPL
jgi:hypothetical protein